MKEKSERKSEKDALRNRSFGKKRHDDGETFLSYWIEYKRGTIRFNVLSCGLCALTKVRNVRYNRWVVSVPHRPVDGQIRYGKNVDSIPCYIHQL